MVAPMKSAATLSLAIVAVSLAATTPAGAAVGDWARGQRSEVRLIASGIGTDGKLAAGIEIVMPQGWHTYWRSPGDAGVPPLVDFSASKNLGPAAIDFPVPTRLDDGFAVTNVYQDRVLLLVSAPIADPTQPVELSVSLQIGVCDEICIPEEVNAVLTVPPGENDAGAAKTLAAARALVPGAAEPGVFALEKASRDGGTENKPVFRFAGVVPDAVHANVFVEGPPDWSPYTPELVSGRAGKATWSVKFSRTGSTVPIAGAKFRVTILSGNRAIDQTLGLD